MPSTNKPLEFKLGRAQLDKQRLPEPQTDRFDAAISRLPKALQALAKDTLACNGELDDLPVGVFELSDKDLLKLFTVFFGELASAAVATWRKLGGGIYHSFGRPMLFRSPKRPELTRSRQGEWLKSLIEPFIEYPSKVTSAEGLAVWAPYFDGSPFSAEQLFGICFDGGQTSAHVGRLLASVIDANSKSSQNVLDTLKLAVEGCHPASMFGLHAIYALWNSRQEDVLDIIFDRLASESNSKVQVSIMRGAVEADIEQLPRLLRLVRDSKALKNKAVASELFAWFGFFGAAYSPKVLEQLIELAVDYLERPHNHQLPLDGVDEERLLAAWSLATHEVEDAVPVLRDWMQQAPAKQRPLILQFASSTDHPCMISLFAAGLDADDPNFVLQSMEAIRPFLSAASESERSEILTKAAQACRRVYAVKPKYPKLFSAKDRKFYDELERLLQKLWTNESLSLLGPAAKDPGLQLDCFIGQGYLPPDDFSIEAILTHVDQCDDTYATILQASPLRPEQWCELLQKKGDGYTAREPIYAKALSQHGPVVFQAALEHIVAQKKSSLRAVGLGILIEALNGPAAKAAQNVARACLAAEPASKVTSDSEAMLRLKLQHLLPAAPAASTQGDEPKKAKQSTKASKTKSSKAGSDHVDAEPESSPQVTPECMPSAKVNALYPGLAITPLRQPVYRPMERMTATGRKILMALDKFIEEHKDKLLLLRPKDPDSANAGAGDVEQLDQWYVRHWTDTYKQTWTNWWKDTGAPLAGPADLARLASYWQEIAHFGGIKLPKGVDLSKLDALRTYPFAFVFPHLAHGTVPSIPETADVKFWRSLRHPRLIDQVFGYLWDSQGTWVDVDYKWDMAESVIAAIPAEVRNHPDVQRNFSYHINVYGWTQLPECLRDEVRPADSPAKQYSQLTRKIPSLEAYGQGQAQLGDVVESLMAIDPSAHYSTVFEYWQIANIRRSSQRAEEWDRFFGFLADKIFDTELNRPAKQLSEWSAIAANVGYLEGYPRFERMLLTTAKPGFTRPTQSLSNQGSLWSRLTAAIYPEKDCDMQAVADSLKSLLKKKQISADHLLQAAFLAPQWCEPIADALTWPKLPSLLEWLLNHLVANQLEPNVALFKWLSTSNRPARMKQDSIGYTESLITNWYDKLKQEKEDKIERSEFTEAVYVSWFYEIAADISDAQWSKLFVASEVLLTPKSAGELKNLVQAMRGKVSRSALLTEVRAAKQPLDARPLALIPLASGAAMGLDLMERYKAIKNYDKQCRRFMDGDTAQERAEYAIAILIFRAGVETEDDLEWIFQAAAADQFAKHREFKSGEITIKLDIDASGKPVSLITKAGKPLKTLPTAVKKNKKVVEQQELLKSLQKFATHSRHVLQRALTQQRWFPKAELERMIAHPVLARQLESLLFTDGTQVGLLGQPQGNALLAIDEQSYRLKADARLRLAHPVDLVAEGWVRWRDWLRDRQQTQVIPQIERGLFLPEYFSAARGAKAIDWPLFGFVCDEFQFRAVLKSLGWDDTRYVRFLSSVNMTAEIKLHYEWLDFGHYVQGVEFTQYARGELTVVDYKAVPLIEFSECMRDVYAAASASVKKGADNSEYEKAVKAVAKLKKQVDSKKLANVRCEGTRFLVDGRLGTYTVDLMSQDIHMAPNQWLPLSAFAPKPAEAMQAAIETLANEKSERTVLKRLRIGS